MTTLVVGSTGQLAAHLRELWPAATFWSRADADLAAPRLLRSKVESARPTAVVIAAAYTSVDKAESEPELAWRVNAEAPAEIARAAASLDVPLVYISTDYVFDGKSIAPYSETDPVAPLNVYGRSKLGGELAVASIARRYWVLRASWVFSEHGGNFAKTMIKVARERTSLRVVADQHGRPTYAGDIAAVVDRLVRGECRDVPFGVHHLLGGVETTWFDFARTILAEALAHGLLARVPAIDAIATEEYPTPARRPLRAVLGTLGSGSVAGITPEWRQGLKSALRALRRGATNATL